jgi:hypothetical protein
MDLLTNAIESIQVGVEDYEAGTRPRLLSAVRNIHAGILLLYKEALRRRSPKDSNDVLIMSKILPAPDANGQIVFLGEGRKTVDTQQIRERFETLGINTDWRRFDRINDARNDVEHLYPRLKQEALQGLISDSFLLVRNFILRELRGDPFHLLGEPTWQKMLDVSEVYEAQRHECDELMARQNWESVVVKDGLEQMACPHCGSDLLRPFEGADSETWIQCCSCGIELNPGQYTFWASMTAHAADQFDAEKLGRERRYGDCPACKTGVIELNEKRCAMCGYSG